MGGEVITANIGHVSHTNDMPLQTIDVRVFLLLHVYIKSSMNLLHTVNIILYMYSTWEHDILYVCCNFDFAYFICCGMRQISMVGAVLVD